jgi:hypothetical protein
MHAKAYRGTTTSIATTMTRKPIPKVYDSVISSLHAVTKFFEGVILQNDTTVIVGLVMIDKETNTKQLKLATLAVPPRINTKEALTVEHHIEKSHFVVHVPKGAAVVRVKMLYKHPNSTHNYFLPQNSKMINFPINDIVDPSSLLITNSSLNRNTYIDYNTSTATHTAQNMKTSLQITYTISDSSMEWLLSQI